MRSKVQQFTDETAFRALDIIRRIFLGIPRADIRGVYEMHVNPLPEHGNQIMHSWLLGCRQSIKGIQKANYKTARGLFRPVYQSGLRARNRFPLDITYIRGDLFLLSKLFALSIFGHLSFWTQLPLSGAAKERSSRRLRTFLRANFFTDTLLSLECPAWSIWQIEE